jgi:ribosomal protein S18 acetylase RimI-like enzyme
MSELRRALEFLTRADHGGTKREPFAYGTAFFDDRVPRRWDSNYLLVEHLPEAAGVSDLVGEAERIQGSAGLRHRKFEVRDEALGARLEPGFRELGWTVSRNVVMVLERLPDRPASDGLVREVALDELREARAEQLRSYEWAAEPDVADQLHAAKRHFAELVETRFFAVVVAGRPVSWADLYLDDGTAQIEDVATLESHRGQGFASAVVLRAADEARLAGADLIFLVADDEDWPKHLYRKLGFDELACVYEFLMARA